MRFGRWPAWVRLTIALAIAVAVALLVPDDPGWLDFVAFLPALALVASVIAGEAGDGAGVFILMVLVAAIVAGAVLGQVAALVVLALLPVAGWLLIDRPRAGRPA